MLKNKYAKSMYRKKILKFYEYQIWDSEKPKYLLVSDYSTNT